jgi:hypothetical protein
VETAAAADQVDHALFADDAFEFLFGAQTEHQILEMCVGIGDGQTLGYFTARPRQRYGLLRGRCRSRLGLVDEGPDVFGEFAMTMASLMRGDLCWCRTISTPTSQRPRLLSVKRPRESVRIRYSNSSLAWRARTASEALMRSRNAVHCAGGSLSRS